MSTSLTGTFSVVGVSSILQVAVGQSANIVLTNSGGHTWRVDLEQMTEGDGGARRLVTYAADQTGALWTNDTDRPARLRLHCVTLDEADTVVYTLQDSIASGTVAATTARSIVCVGPAKAGTTAGWVVAAANNIGKLATLPLNISAGTLVMRIPNLAVGDRIVGAYLVGSLQATAGQHTTIALDLRSLTAAVAGATDARVAVSATLDVVANTIMSSANTAVASCDHTMIAGESLYALITATTPNNAACTAEIQSVVLQVIPASCMTKG
jgi:hypothetical protein